MRKIAILFVALVPLAGMAQKEIKPSASKAEKAWREKKLDVAKSIIDVTVASQEFMRDKKGQYSKNAATAWYIRGLIYMAIDTTTKQEFKSLEAHPFPIAKASFDSAYAIDKGKSAYFIKDSGGMMPMLFDQVNGQVAQRYLNNAIDAYTKQKDYQKAFDYIERALYFIPNDTSQLLNAGAYFAPAANEDDKAIGYLNHYLEKGGKNQDAYLQLISIYQDKKKDNVKTLEVIKKAEAEFPNNGEFPKYELNLYINEKNYSQARKSVLALVKKDPNDKTNLYLLGQLYEELHQLDSAKIAFQKAVNIDPEYFESNLKLAALYYQEGRKIKTERDHLGITAKDIARRKELLVGLREKYKIALPYWVRCEKLKPDDENVLFTLADIYTTLVMDEDLDRINKRIKALGLDK